MRWDHLNPDRSDSLTDKKLTPARIVPEIGRDAVSSAFGTEQPMNAARTGLAISNRIVTWRLARLDSKNEPPDCD